MRTIQEIIGGATPYPQNRVIWIFEEIKYLPSCSGWALAGSEFLDARDLVQVKYEMVRRVRVDGASVSGSAAAFGFSRPSYYLAAAAIEDGGLAFLVPVRPGPRRAHELTDEVVSFAAEAKAGDPGQR